MSAITAPRIVRFTASRDQPCLSPWECSGITAGQRGGYVPTDGAPAAYCQTCANQAAGIDDSTGICPCARGKADGFTDVGTADAPRFVHSACGLPAYSG